MPTGCTIYTIFPADTPNTGRWKINENFQCLSTGAATGFTSSVFTNANATTVNVGGIYSGTTFGGNYTLQQMFDLLLYKAIRPTFTAFEIDNQISPIEVGSAITGNQTFTWTLTDTTDLSANSITITDVTQANQLATGLANDGTETIALPSSVAKSSPASNVWSINAQDTDSNSHTKTFTVEWKYRVFFGESTNTTLTEAQIESLGSQLADDIDDTYTFSPSGDYLYLAVPDSFLPAVAFRNTSDNTPVLMAGPQQGYSDFDGNFYYDEVNVTRNGISIDYKVYRSRDTIASGPISVQVTYTGGTFQDLQSVINAGPNATGNTYFEGNMNVNGNLTATTIFSGSTNLNYILGLGGTGGTSHNKTYVQEGTNIFTGGTEDSPTVNVSPNFTSITGATIYSGTTNLGDLITGSAGSDTWVQPGLNIYTGGTPSEPIVGTEGSVSFTAMTATTIYSGSTNLGDLITGEVGSDTYVQPSSNIYTGGTANLPIVGIIGSPTFSGTVTAQGISGATISATTYYSGSTPLNDILGSGGGSSGENTLPISGGTGGPYTFTGNTYNNGELTATTYHSGTTPMNDLFSSTTNVVDFVTAGENLVSGDLVFLATDGKYWKTSHTNEASASTELRLVFNAIATDAVGEVLSKGRYNTTGLSQGGSYWLSAGTISIEQPSGDTNIVRYVGTAESSTVFEFNPDELYVEISSNNTTVQNLLRNITTSQAALSSDFTLNCTEPSLTVTLPTAIGIQGKIYNVKNSSTGSTVVMPTAAQTIDSFTSVTQTTKQSFTYQSDGSNWILI